MIKDNKIYFGKAGKDLEKELYLLPNMANRHGFICGATGTGKTITLKVLAESFSDLGVPVFLADVKGDLSGMIEMGSDSEDMIERKKRFKIEDTFKYDTYPTNFFDIYQNGGIPLRTTVSEMGPQLLSTVLDLNETQSDVLSVIFKIADDEKLILSDTKDLKAMLNYVSDHHDDFKGEYGNMAPQSIAAIIRAIVALEGEGADVFFGEPAINVADLFTTGDRGKGMINILDSSSLINKPKLYSAFMLYLLSELFEILPEVGDLDKPRLVFFFDEAHLLFDNADDSLLEKIEQMIKLIRSKGVGVFFITQSPKDIPDGVMSQLANKIQHALRAYTPADRKALKIAAESFRENPEFDTAELLEALGTGEAIVSVLDEEGVPSIAEHGFILPPQSKMGKADSAKVEQAIKMSNLYLKYNTPVDPDSAYEFLERQNMKEAEEKAEEEAQKEQEKEAAKLAKEQEKEAQRLAKEAAKAEEKQRKELEKSIKSVGNTAVGTIGREIGNALGGTFGKFGKKLGGNVGASLARNIFGTLFKK